MSDPVHVFDADNMAEAELLREELNAAGISARIDSTLSPLDGLTSMGQGTPVYVDAADADQAARIIEQFVEDSTRDEEE